MENVHKAFKKIFTHNIGLKVHNTAVHERKDLVVINVAKILQ